VKELFTAISADFKPRTSKKQAELTPLFSPKSRCGLLNVVLIEANEK